MRDPETLGGPEGEGNPITYPAVGNSTVSFIDPEEANVELIGFTYYETEENCVTWVWQTNVVTNIITYPLHRIKEIRTFFEATGV